jgi:hypothetical protein
MHESAEKKKDKNSKQLWYIPLSYTYGNISSDNWTTSPSKWLEKRESLTIGLPRDINDTWVYFNVLAIGRIRSSVQT